MEQYVSKTKLCNFLNWGEKFEISSDLDWSGLKSLLELFYKKNLNNDGHLWTQYI